MPEIRNTKQYDLEDRTFKFAKNIFAYTKLFPKGIREMELTKQLIRSAGSIGANYIEANESLSRKDFLMRIKICRKEAKESRYWIALSEPFTSNIQQQKILYQEATELMKIFGSIITKTE